MKIKICGLMREKDVLAVNEAKPDFIGMIFAKSRRQIHPDLAFRIRQILIPEISAVGVFVDAPLSEVIGLAKEGLFDIIQLHGEESEDYIQEVKLRTGLPVIKAIRVKNSGDILPFQEGSADYLLLDNGKGTGKQFDWRFIEPEKIKKPWFFAGGVNEENLHAAAGFHPYALDISSGAESNGQKNREKIIQLVSEVRKI